MRPTLRAVWLFAAAFVVALLPVLLGIGWWTVWVGVTTIALAALGTDFLLAPSPRRISVTAELPEAMYVGEEEPVRLQLRAPGPLRLRLVADVAAPLAPLEASWTQAPGTALLPLRAERRGEGVLEEIWLRWTGPLGLVARQKRQVIAGRIPVIPNVRQVRGAAIRFFQSPNARAGLKIERYLGDGSEFESLREYTPGMDHRAIDWKSSARRKKLLCQQFRAERNHQVVVAVDTGHLMREPLGGVPRLDHAINAALVVGYCALRFGDRVGLYAFDDGVRLFLAPQGAVQTFPRIVRATSQLEYRAAETNFTLGLAELSTRLHRRSLVVLFTDFVDVIGAELMLENLDRLARRHLVVFVTLRDPELETLAAQPPRSVDRIAQSVVASDLARERETVLRRLRRMGVLCIDAPPEGISTQLLDRYLHVKRREMV
jgi:uncharacterized protein (DUF58 family)